MNKTQISKELKEAVFAPGKPGPMKIIVDVGDSDYYIRRAKEFLDQTLDGTYDRAEYQEILTKALSLIALAKVTNE